MIPGHEGLHGFFRKQIVEHMYTCNEKLEAYMNANINTYLDESATVQVAVWATEAEILGAASMLSVDILVHAKYGEDMSWLCFPHPFA
jgi:hypothetical protein